MKVIKKPKLPIQTCTRCGAVLKVEVKDLISSGFTEAKDSYRCKVCRGINLAVFKNTKNKEV